MLFANLDGSGSPVVPVVSAEEEQVAAVERSVAALQRTRDSISDVSGSTLRPVLERRIESRRILAENLRRNSSVIVRSPAPSHSTPDPSVDLEDPYFEDSNEDILPDQENLPLQPRQQPRAERQPLQVLWSRSQEDSVQFQVYQDPPQRQPLNQIPVLPTPSSVGEDSFQEQAPPSYESVMASSGGGARARVPTGLGIATLPDLEQRRLADKMMRSMVKLKSLLELYKPDKYSPEVCRAKEEMWTEKIERSFLELQEDMY